MTKRAVLYPEPGMKLCAGCKAVKPEAEFHFKSRSSARRMSYCKMCKRARRDAEIVTMRTQSAADVAERFFAKVNKTPTCWLWTGWTGNVGYGRFHFRGRAVQAHVVSLLIAGVDVPSRWETGLVVDHLCRKPECVNPAHLRIVLQTDNCGVLARPTPHWTNKSKTHCIKGHPLAGGNLAIAPGAGKPTRVCLTCEPSKWMYAVEPRDPPPNARCKAWRGPFRKDGNEQRT